MLHKKSVKEVEDKTNETSLAKSEETIQELKDQI
jgi:hypothetical protein